MIHYLSNSFVCLQYVRSPKYFIKVTTFLLAFREVA